MHSSITHQGAASNGKSQAWWTTRFSIMTGNIKVLGILCILLSFVYLETTVASESDCSKVKFADGEDASYCQGEGNHSYAGNCHTYVTCECIGGHLTVLVNVCTDEDEIYLEDQCIKSSNLDDCPQKNCGQYWEDYKKSGKKPDGPKVNCPKPPHDPNHPYPEDLEDDNDKSTTTTKKPDKTSTYAPHSSGGNTFSSLWSTVAFLIMSRFIFA